VGIGAAWAMGLAADVSDASLFGQHALAYSILAFGGMLLNRRIQLLDLKQQTLQVFPVLLCAYIAYTLVHWQSQGYIAWAYFLGAFTSALMWVPMTLLLQRLRRPVSNPDDL
jgi:rod shape-determining protein MreD